MPRIAAKASYCPVLPKDIYPIPKKKDDNKASQTNQESVSYFVSIKNCSFRGRKKRQRPGKGREKTNLKAKQKHYSENQASEDKNGLTTKS